MVTIAQHLRAEGRKQGLEQGREDKGFQIAHKLYEKGVSLTEIADLVEIPVEKLKPQLEAKKEDYIQL